MPRFIDAKQLNQRKYNTFMDRNNPKFQTVQQFARKLTDIGDDLVKNPEDEKFAKQLQKFGMDLAALQMGQPIVKESQIDTAIWDVNNELGKFLKEDGNYQRLLNAGKESGLSQEQLDNALGIIGKDMDVQLVPNQEQKDKSREAEQKRLEEQAQLQAENDLYALKVDMEEREKAAEKKKEKAEEKEQEEKAERKSAPILGGGKKKPQPEEEDELEEDEPEDELEDEPEAEQEEPVNELDRSVNYGKGKSVNVKSYIESRMRDVRNGKTLNAEDLAKIMVAREITGTKGGKAADLDVKASPIDIETRARRLAQNKQFQAWAQSLGKDGAKDLLSGRTHGGKMEKNFTKFLANRPIGALSNDKELARHMPTAKERIEAIQAQLETKDPRNVGRPDLVQAAAAAEIIQIRRDNHVQRGGAGLDRKLAVTDVAEKKLTNTVKNTVQAFGMEGLLSRAAQTQLMGQSRTHGGAMQDYVREVGLRSEFGGIREYAELDTRGGRMKALQNEARTLNSQLKAAQEKNKPTKELMERSRQNALEFYALNTGLMEPQGKPLPEPRRTQALQETIPWERTDKIMKATESDPTFRKVTGDVDSMMKHMQNEVMGLNLDPEVKQGPQAPQLEQQKEQGDPVLVQ